MSASNTQQGVPLTIPPPEDKTLDLAQTILTGLGLFGVVGVFVAIAALGIERVRRIRQLDRGHEATKAAFVGPFTTQAVSPYQSLLGYQAPPVILPTIGGLIEAADRNFWTSRTLDHMDGLHPDLTWLPLYESIFDDLRHPDLSGLPGLWTQNPILSRVFAKMSLNSNENEKHHDAALSDKHRRLVRDKYLESGIRRLSARPQAGSKDEGKGLARLKPAWMVGKRPCIPVTREELAAMSLIMGMPIKHDNAGFYSGIGAYGLSIDIAHTDAGWKLSLFKGSRIPRHAPSMGSGYTSLMAKHLACGSIPFDELQDCVRSVYMTDDVLDGIKAGLCITDTQAYGGQSLEFLRRLPGDKAVDAYYLVASAANSTDPGSILNGVNRQVGRWAKLITGIAFGGLVPQADKNVIEAVKLTLAGTNLDGCVQCLEPLIDMLHAAIPKQQPPHDDDELDIFGERVASRNRTTGFMYVNHTFPSTDKNPRDAASTFARYMNLLEHILARAPSPANPGPDSQPSDAVFDHTEALLEKVHKGVAKAAQAAAAGTNTTPTLTAEETRLLSEDYAQTLTNITRDLQANIPNAAGTATIPNIDISLDQAAAIVRCILAAWAHTVPQIDVVQKLAVDELPSVVALG
ncbi:hypothetical protein QBC44DRAFT_326154 [Cladorrhinum sp. PSN332]|nr:hypothetical protein QBC44DRAFT_326154 [Cladorrhinum sp. PSN332]